MGDLKDLFKDLDANVINLDKVEDEVFVYNATDVLVQTTWELPIVIQCPESVVNFEFCSNPGDISFGIVFVAAPEEDQDLNDLDIETVEEMSIVRSSLDSISGSFEVPYEGVVFFMWDNNFDWSANKQISYMVEVKQPSFSYCDRIRVESSLSMLRETEEELNSCYARCADAQDLIEHNTANELFMVEQLQALQLKLDSKLQEKKALDEEIVKCHTTINLGVAAKAGLCIRMLDKHLLSVVIGYLNLQGGVNYVCKYWASLAEMNRNNPGGPISGPIYVERLKLSKSAIRTSLAQIHLAVKLDEMKKLQLQQTNAGVSTISPQSQSATITAVTSLQSGSKPTDAHILSDSELDDGTDNGIDLKERSNNVIGKDIANISSKSNKSTGSIQVSYDNLLPRNHNDVIGKNAKKNDTGRNNNDGKRPHEAFTTPVAHPLSPLMSKPGKTLNQQQSNADANSGDVKADDSQKVSQKQRSKVEEAKLPLVAEGKKRANRPHRSSRRNEPSKSSGNGRSRQANDRDRSLLQHVQKIRSEQQLNAMIEYLQGGFVKIESISNEKRRIKKLIRAWNTSFEKKHGRYPTSNERKGHLRELYEEYHQVSLALRIRNERMDETLKSVGLTRETFEQLREKQQIDW